MDMTVAIVLGVLVVWELAWKGWALWRAARRTARVWYVVLLVVNTAGILEIVYILISRREPERLADADPRSA